MGNRNIKIKIESNKKLTHEIKARRKSGQQQNKNGITMTVRKKTETRKSHVKAQGRIKEQGRNRRRKHDNGKIESHEARRKQNKTSRRIKTTAKGS